jgi:hypothetical protein
MFGGILSPTLQYILGSRPGTASPDEQSEVDEVRVPDAEFHGCLFEDGKEIQKKILIYFYSGMMIELDIINGDKKMIPCSSIFSIAEHEDEKLIIVMRQRADGGTPCDAHKVYRLTSLSETRLLKQYITGINESGQHIRATFDSMSNSSTAMIAASVLKRSLIKEGLAPSDEEVFKMLSMEGGNGKQISFNILFKILLNSHVYSVNDCLTDWLNRACDEEQVVTRTVDPIQSLIDGEILMNEIKLCRWSIHMGKAPECSNSFTGSVFITNYRVVLSCSIKISSHTFDDRFKMPRYFRELSVPLASISKIFSVTAKNMLQIMCKDLRFFHIYLPIGTKLDAYTSFLHDVSFVGLNSPKLFAYSYMSSNRNVDEWSPCDIRAEYFRQGITPENNWQVYENENWSICETYPLHLALPLESNFGIENIMIAARFRSKCRLPVITFRCVETGAVMTRSSQPMVGITQKHCPTDEFLLNLYRMKGQTPSSADSKSNDENRFYIFDARYLLSATANMALGKGTERESNYDNTELIFLNIENIHVMRNSHAAMGDALLPGGYADICGSGSYLSKVDDSNWLQHIRAILSAAVLGAKKLFVEGASILSHCSDGWDRTSQICSVTQLLLDPFFRTIQGLAVLIEKDWCAFGFKFQDRHGHGMDHGSQPDERAPIFVQFLDVVYQLLYQFPKAFEYNETFLLFLADHSYSCLFGNFFGNCTRDRIAYGVQEKTKSIWGYVFLHLHQFKNASYEKTLKPLWPSTAPKRIVIWSRYFNRWDPSMHPRCGMVPDEAETAEQTTGVWFDDWGCGI